MKTWIVDSFTDRPFRGNPAGVCVVEQETTSERMLDIARELGLSETAFVTPLDLPGRFSIRYFSPVMEIPLCGHATLAAGRVLIDAHGFDVVRFLNINALELTARAVGEEIQLEFPLYDTVPADAPVALLDALGIERVVNVVYNADTKILLVEIEDSRVLAALEPDYVALVASHDSINGVLVTAPSHAPEFDFQSRYFWPWSGTNEDPVTGGTHTFLAGYWSTRLGKTRMRSFQASARGGYMAVEILDDRLLITSPAVVVFEGALQVR